MSNLTKYCKGCQEHQPLDKFYKSKRESLGVSDLCKIHFSLRCKERYERKKEEILAKNKVWELNNPEKMREYKKAYKHSEHGKSKTNARYALRYKNDPNFKLKVLTKSTLQRLFKHTKKTKKSIHYFGCSLGELKTYLQNTAYDNGYFDFDINNFDGNEYHIDHVIPFSRWTEITGRPIDQSNSFKNLQILKASENLIKSDSI